MNTDIDTALTECIRDTIELLWEDPDLSGGAADLTNSYAYLSDVTTLDPQGLFEAVLRAAHELTTRSQHQILVAGDSVADLYCSTCDELLSVHDGGEKLVAFVNDLDAISTILTIRPAARGADDPAALPRFH